ncbi:MAG: heparin lyase I family protein [Anaerolineae bacterium]|nr:heparin lyase I family protein [Gemmatimonadaceae bacterium]
MRFRRLIIVTALAFATACTEETMAVQRPEDTAVRPLPSRTLAVPPRLVLTPDVVILRSAGKQLFTATKVSADGTRSPANVVFSTTYGIVSTAGLYSAGSKAGSWQVVARDPVTGQADTSAVVLVPPDNISFHEGFESGTVGELFKVGCCAHSVRVQQEMQRSGLYSARAELRATDPVAGASKRSELRVTSGNIVGGVGSERWYGLRIYIPDSWQVDVNREDYQILAQWHNLPDTELGERYTPPPLAIWIDKGEWSIWNYWDPNAVSELTKGAPAAPGGRMVLWRGAFSRGRWTDWVVHVKWSYGADGLLEIWKDGQRVVSRTGPNTYNDRRPLYFMAGIYKWMWSNPGGVWSQPTRVAYFDDLRIAGSVGSYAAVAPR